MTLEAFREAFLPHLRLELSERVAKASKTTDDALLASWFTHLLALSQGGKCLRPYLVYTFYAACGGKAQEEFLKTSVFAEIFHLFALVHDDIIDEGTVRHGLPTSQVYVRETMEREARTGKLEHIAEGQAILLGDLLLLWATDIVASADVPGMDRSAVWASYREMVETVIIGEMLDVDICTRPTTTMDHIERKTLLKSGHYSMLHPLVLGAAFAGSAKGMALAREAGTPLGLAFQMQDDYLDIVGDDKHVGKLGMNDLAEGQHTFFSQYVVENGTEEQKTILTNLRGKRVNAEEAEQARAAYRESRALEIGKKAIEEGYDRGRDILLGAEFLQKESREELAAFIEKLKGRTR